MAEEESSGGVNVGLVAVLVLAYAGGQWMMLTAIDTKLEALEQRIVDSAAHVRNDVSAVEQRVAMSRGADAMPKPAGSAEMAEGAAGAPAEMDEEAAPAAPAAPKPAAPAPAPAAPKPAAPAPAAPAPAAPKPAAPAPAAPAQ